MNIGIITEDEYNKLEKLDDTTSRYNDNETTRAPLTTRAYSYSGQQSQLYQISSNNYKSKYSNPISSTTINNNNLIDKIYTQCFDLLTLSNNSSNLKCHEYSQPLIAISCITLTRQIYGYKAKWEKWPAWFESVFKFKFEHFKEYYNILKRYHSYV